MPLTIKKKGVEQKAKAKAKAKAIGPFFFGLDVFFGVAISFYLSSKTGLFSFHLLANGSWSGPVPTYVVSQSRLVVTHSGSDPATSRGSAFPDWCHLFSPDPDLGPDPSPGSAIRRSGLSVNLRRQKLWFLSRFLSLNRSGSRLPGLSPPSCAWHVIRIRCPDDSDQSGKVRIRVLDSDPGT